MEAPEGACTRVETTKMIKTRPAAYLAPVKYTPGFLFFCFKYRTCSTTVVETEKIEPSGANYFYFWIPIDESPLLTVTSPVDRGKWPWPWPWPCSCPVQARSYSRNARDVCARCGKSRLIGEDSRGLCGPLGKGSGSVNWCVQDPKARGGRELLRVAIRFSRKRLEIVVVVDDDDGRVRKPPRCGTAFVHKGRSFLQKRRDAMGMSRPCCARKAKRRESGGMLWSSTPLANQ